MSRPPAAALPRLIPGLALAGVIGVLATLLAGWIGTALGYETSPVSAILVAVFLGLVIRNTVGLTETFEPGLRLCVRRLLRIGVALLGIRLSLAAAASIGVFALPVVVGTIAAALLLVTGLSRLLRVPPRLGLLIAAGTSICGITAIVAVAPVVNADETETSYAVATIALFGMLALFTYPFLAHALFAVPTQAGLFLGTAIHDTSQVVGAALAYREQFRAPEALDAAVVTKLMRNLCMVVVIPLMGWLARSRGTAGAAAASRGPILPLFILGFLGMTLLRTVGDLGERSFGVLDPATWEQLIGWVQGGAEIALLLAMAAVGLGTTLRQLYALGLRPFAVGLGAALTVGAVGATLIHLLAATTAL